MPRDGSNVYTVPSGTEGIPDQSIESAKYNSFAHDVEQDLNFPRPIIAGGTGTTSADGALAALGALKSTQLVTNYDSHLYYPGSFYSASTATNPPVAGHAFSGIVYSSDPPTYPPANLNLTVYATDLNDTVVPGRNYVREKKAGVWSAWVYPLNNITLPGDPQVATQVNTDNDESIATTRFVKNVAVQRVGDTMTGALNVFEPATGDANAVGKKYVDDKVAAGVASIVTFPAGTVMVFHQTSAPTGWTKRTDYNDIALRVVNGGVTAKTNGYAFSTVFSQTTTAGHAIDTNQMPSHLHGASIYDPSHYHTLNGGNGSVTVGYPIGQCPASGGNPQCGTTSVSVDYAGTGVRVWNGSNMDATYYAGGNAAHSHAISMSVNYVDVILATKN